jgi:hypothetical protein
MTSKLFSSAILASAVLAGLAATPAMAQGTYTPNIDQSQQQISARIQQGLQSGRITASEAQQLYRRDREIDLREARAKGDGYVTPQEREQLRADLASLGAEVERLIANREVVGSPTGGIDKRQFNIGQRIDDALRNNRISPREAQMLHGREHAIERQEASYKADGVVTQRELTALSNEVDRMVYNGRRG